MIRILGRCSVDGAAALPTRHARRLLVLLAMHPKQGLDRRVAADALWPGSDRESAAQNLRTCLKHLRSALGEQIEADRQVICLRNPLVDALEFERLIAAGDLREAIELYRGPLGGLDAPDVAEEELDDLWDFGWASRLESSVQQVLVELATDAWHKGDQGLANEYFERALGGDRAEESPYLLYADLLERDGRPEEGYRIFRRLLKTLEARKEAPSAEAVERGRQLRQRLRRISRTVEQVQSKGGQLDSLRASFSPGVGLELKVAELVDCLKNSRLVSLIGPGGIGKTRAAVEVGFEEGPLRFHGAVWVDLSGASDASFSTHLREAGANELQDTDALVILDNCETALDSVRTWVTEILRSSVRTSVLVTSREELGVTNERVYRIAPLTDEESRALLNEAMRRTGRETSLEEGNAELLEETGGMPLAIEITAARVAEIGYAATLREMRTGILDANIPGGSRDRPERHSSLWRCVRSTVDQLSATECREFFALSVFPGSFTAPQAAAICGSVDLSRLSRGSLLVREGDRYRMLPPIRRYAAAHLEGGDFRDAHAAYFFRAAGELSTGHRGDRSELAKIFRPDLPNFRAAHAYLSTTKPAEAIQLASLLAPAVGFLGLYSEVVGMFETCYENARKVDTLVANQALLGLGPAAKSLGQLRKALWAYEQAASSFGISDRPRDLGACHLNAALVHIDLGDYTSARAALGHASVAFAAYFGLADAREIAFVQGNVLKADARLAMHEGRLFDAEARGLEALALARQIDDHHSCAVILNNLGDLYMLKGEVNSAAFAYAENEEAARRCQDVALIAHARLGLANVRLVSGDGRESLRLAQDALSFFSEAGSRRESCSAIEVVGATLILEGESLRAGKLIFGARAVQSTSNYSPNYAVTLSVNGLLPALESELGARLCERIKDLSSGTSLHTLLALAREVG